jgi:hypothetical protein
MAKHFIKSGGYLISPRGEILPLAPDSSHIREVVKNPHAFGYTCQEIEDIFSIYNEPIGTEGKARQKIIRDLITRRWIRIRRYTRPDRWTVNLPHFNDRTRDILKHWADLMIQVGYSRHEEVHLMFPEAVHRATFQNLFEDDLYK